jgi:hypothetical protein
LLLVLSGRLGLKNERLGFSFYERSPFLHYCRLVFLHHRLGYDVKWLLVLSMFFTLVASSKEKYRCVKWAWTGDVYNRKVVCLEWQKVDRK